MKDIIQKLKNGETLELSSKQLKDLFKYMQLNPNSIAINVEVKPFPYSLFYVKEVDGNF